MCEGSWEAGETEVSVCSCIVEENMLHTREEVHKSRRVRVCVCVCVCLCVCVVRAEPISPLIKAGQHKITATNYCQ